jgi:hypothetical protein
MSAQVLNLVLMRMSCLMLHIGRQVQAIKVPELLGSANLLTFCDMQRVDCYLAKADECEHVRGASSTVICCQACRSGGFSEHVVITQHQAGDPAAT